LLTWEKVEECAIETGIVDKLEVVFTFFSFITHLMKLMSNFECFMYDAKLVTEILVT